MTVDTTSQGEVEQYQPAPIAIPAPSATNETARQLASWVEAARSAHSLAMALVRTYFVPTAFRGKPEEAAAAILSGAEIGLSPMAALKAFDVIQGQAAPRAITLRAVVQSRGHEVWVEEESPQRAVVCGRRKGSDREQRSEWTLEKARGLDLLGKDNWKKQPAAMLVARATSELCRRVASDAILGIPYSAEELWDAAEPQDAPAVAEGRGLRARAMQAKGAPVRPRSSTPAAGIPLGESFDAPTDLGVAPEIDPNDPTLDPSWGQS